MINLEKLLYRIILGYYHIYVDNKKYKVGISWKTGNLLELHRSINLEEFANVDSDSMDMDTMELFDIRNRLIQLSQV